MVMHDGRKSVAERIVYGAFDQLKKAAGTNEVLTVFHKSIENVRPQVELKARRVGGATYQIPLEVRHDPRVIEVYLGASAGQSTGATA